MQIEIELPNNMINNNLGATGNIKSKMRNKDFALL